MPASAALDPKLTAKAKGILAWMYAKSKEYRPTYADMCAENKIGYHAASGAVKELVAAGYLELRSNRAEDGKVHGANYLLVGHYGGDLLLEKDQ